MVLKVILSTAKTLLKKLPLFVLLMGLTTSCWWSGPKTTQQVEDNHESFKSGLNSLIQEVLDNHGACMQWRENYLLSFYEEVPEDSQLREAYVYHRIRQNLKEEEVVKISQNFDYGQLHRYREYVLFHYPLNFPTSERNLTHYIEQTHHLPECDTTFEEYGFFDAILGEMKLGNYSNETHLKFIKALTAYISYIMTQEHFPFTSALTSSALIRTMAEVGILEEEVFFEASRVLIEAQQYHRDSLVSFNKVVTSSDKPSVEEMRAILVLHRDRMNTTQALKQRLGQTLQASARYQEFSRP